MCFMWYNYLKMVVGNNMYFEYGTVETEYLAKKDKKLGEAIEQIGHINRLLDNDLFSSVVHHIVGQQISVAAQATVFKRMKELLTEVTAETIAKAETEQLQKCGMTYKKVEYIKSFCNMVLRKEIVLEELNDKSDEEVIKILSAIKGIGVWTAEMILTFSMSRPNVISYGDLAILRGMRMLYRHRDITPQLFNKYKKRYSPYATTAALYFWAIAAGRIPELTDPKPQKKKVKK